MPLKNRGFVRPMRSDLPTSLNKQCEADLAARYGRKGARQPAAAQGRLREVTIDFPVFEDYQGRQIVTKDIFGGFGKYDSYCFRCHGFDAVVASMPPISARHWITV